MNSNKSDALGPDLLVQAYGIDQACGRPAPWIRSLNNQVWTYSVWLIVIRDQRQRVRPRSLDLNNIGKILTAAKMRGPTVHGVRVRQKFSNTTT